MARASVRKDKKKIYRGIEGMNKKNRSQSDVSCRTEVVVEGRRDVGSRQRPERLSLASVDPVLRRVRDLESSFLSLAGSRLIATSSLDAVHSVDAAGTEVLLVDELQPLDGAFVLSAGTGGLGSVDAVLLGNHGVGEGRYFGVVEVEGWDRCGRVHLSEEVVAHPFVVAFQHEVAI